eukprot:GHVU01202562.1.p2 GENE.GHVU01202562.1~~GHVU01202562.1.p2  ORF type:complete len:127 (+),score=9.10 GHVU01202562.1:340-720(+)
MAEAKFRLLGMRLLRVVLSAGRNVSPLGGRLIDVLMGGGRVDWRVAVRGGRSDEARAEEGPAAAAAVVVMVGWIETVIPLVRSSLSPQSWTATVCTHACTHACMHAPTPSPVRACLQRVGCRLLHS